MNKNLNLQSIKNIHLTVSLPSSKSISNRALILNVLADSPYPIKNLSDCDDTRVTLNVLESNNNMFDIGAAGTAMRFLTAFLAKTFGEWVITGSDRMKQRPIKILVDALKELGANIEYVENEGYPPLRIYGTALMGGEISLNGSVSSQYISALMMIAPYTYNGLNMKLEGKVISLPYIHMTMSMMKEYGVDTVLEDNCIKIAPQTYKPISYTVESDWSSASYWFEILSVIGCGEVFLKGLKKNSLQGDSNVAELYKLLGVNTEYKEDGVLLSSTNVYTTKFEYDFINQPDLAQTFAVNCCLCNIEFVFNGLQSLKIKETNRIEALINELKKAGYVLYEPSEGQLAWGGTRCEKAAEIQIATYHDHRMAMAFAPIAFKMPIVIENPEVVSKSYPQFWDDFETLVN